MPRLVKLCPDCGNRLHARKSKCTCGHVFVRLRPSLGIQSTSEAELDHRRYRTACQTRKRALQSECESDQRRKENAACKALKRSLESEHESDQRRKADAACKALKRSLESEHESDQRRKADAACKAHRKALCVSVQRVIDSFIMKTKQGPDYVCTSCHRLMYRQTVVPLSIEKYAKAYTDS